MVVKKYRERSAEEGVDFQHDTESTVRIFMKKKKKKNSKDTRNFRRISLYHSKQPRADTEDNAGAFRSYMQIEGLQLTRGRRSVAENFQTRVCAHG